MLQEILLQPIAFLDINLSIEQGQSCLHSLFPFIYIHTIDGRLISVQCSSCKLLFAVIKFTVWKTMKCLLFVLCFVKSVGLW